MKSMGQEEMVGFALIIILVTVILVIFLGFGLNDKKEEVQSYETESFIQSILSYTTGCRDNFEYLPVQELIFSCVNERECLDGEDTCGVLNSTLRDIVKESWDIREGSKIKGYELQVVSNDGRISTIREGNETSNSRGASQDFFRTGDSITVLFTVYS